MKLGEVVEWLERNYDRYEVQVSSGGGFGLAEMTTWWAPLELRCERYELGWGSSHQQPMFTFKDDSHSKSDSYHWFANQFVPLSPESEGAPLDEDA